MEITDFENKSRVTSLQKTFYLRNVSNSVGKLLKKYSSYHHQKKNNKINIRSRVIT